MFYSRAVEERIGKMEKNVYVNLIKDCVCSLLLLVKTLYEMHTKIPKYGVAKDTKEGWQMIQNRGWRKNGWQVYYDQIYMLKNCF